MHYIQNSPIQVHGNLKSSNVLIDSRWTSKVTDHGLFLFKEGQEIDVEAGTEAKYYGILKFLYSKQIAGTLRHDKNVYSFGTKLKFILLALK